MKSLFKKLSIKQLVLAGVLVLSTFFVGNGLSSAAAYHNSIMACSGNIIVSKTKNVAGNGTVTTLKLGDTGMCVRNVQVFLQKIQNPSLVVNGKFDLATEVEVKAFQSKHSIIKDANMLGVVEYETYQWMMMICSWERYYRPDERLINVCYGTPRSTSGIVSH